MEISQSPNNPVIDGMRALAIILVIFFHVNFILVKLLPEAGLLAHIENSPLLLNISWHGLGSEVIFFLSAYLLTLSLLKQLEATGKIDFYHFYIKRVARILPLYVIAVALYAPTMKFDLTDLFANLFFVSKLFGLTTIIPVGWSLELQMQFYLLLPVLVVLLNCSSAPLFILLAALVGSLYLRWSFLQNPDFLEIKFAEMYQNKVSDTQKNSYYLIHYRMSALILGMMCAYMITYQFEFLSKIYKDTIVSRLLVFAGLAMVFIAAFAPVHDHQSWFYIYLSDSGYIAFMSWSRALFITGIMAVLFKLLIDSGRIKWVVMILGNRVFRYISQSIYPLYLFHFPFIALGFVMTYWTIDKDIVTSISRLQLLSILIISIASATAFAHMVHRFVELPIQRRILTRFQKREPPS